MLPPQGEIINVSAFATFLKSPQRFHDCKKMEKNTAESLQVSERGLLYRFGFKKAIHDQLLKPFNSIPSISIVINEKPIL
jgi:hypothetical protein